MNSQEPVAWAYTINNSHSVFSAERPPEDAYDEGTLFPLFAAPVLQSVSEGWQMVPKEPTEAMLEAGSQNGWIDKSWLESGYKDMLAAAPSPQEDAP